MIWLWVVLFALFGFFLYRLRGTDLLPRWAVLVLWSLPITIATVIAGAPWITAPAVFLLTAGATSMGHGSYMDLGRFDRNDDEWSKSLLDWIFGKDRSSEGKPNRLRDHCGLALGGLIMTIPAGVAIGLWGDGVLAGLLAGLSGLLKSPMYGSTFYIKYPQVCEHMHRGEWGEAMFGFAVYLCVGLAAF